MVGESGSGKSTIARIIARLERPTAGRIVLSGPDGAPVRNRAYRHHVQMVFQDPFASLNPFHSVEHHLARPLRLHGRTRTRAQTRQAVAELLERVSLSARDIAHRRPHELSGGQRQRVAIARALAPGATVLVADEPVSMLDVSIRLGVLDLLARLRREEHLAVLYITHDLATARHFADDLLVLYRGRVVERGPADEVIRSPQHPYTKLLAAASPDPYTRGRRFDVTPEDVIAAGSAPPHDHQAPWGRTRDSVRSSSEATSCRTKCVELTELGLHDDLARMINKAVAVCLELVKAEPRSSPPAASAPATPRAWPLSGTEPFRSSS